MKIKYFATILLGFASADHLEIPEDFTDGQVLPDGFFDEHEAGPQDDVILDQYEEPEIGVDQLYDAYNDDILPYGEDELIAQSPFMSMLHDINMCAVKIVHKYNISAEIKAMSEIVGNKEYLDRLENGNASEVRAQISEAITPMFQKMMNQTGQEIVRQMPPELIDWFKDTTIVVVKHGGQVEGYQFSMSEDEINKNKPKKLPGSSEENDTAEISVVQGSNSTNLNETQNSTQSDLIRNQTLQNLLDQIQDLYPNATIKRSTDNKIDITLDSSLEVEVPVVEAIDTNKTNSTNAIKSNSTSDVLDYNTTQTTQDLAQLQETDEDDDQFEEQETEEHDDAEEQEETSHTELEGEEDHDIVEDVQEAFENAPTPVEEESEDDDDDSSYNISINVDLNTNQHLQDRLDQAEQHLEEMQDQLQDKKEEIEDKVDDLDLEGWSPYGVSEEVEKAQREAEQKINENLQKIKDDIKEAEIDQILIDEDFNSEKVVDKINEIIEKTGSDYYNGYRNKANQYSYYATTGYYTNAHGNGYYKAVDTTGYYQPKIKYKTQAEYANRDQYRVVTVPRKKPDTIGKYIEKKAKDWFNWHI